MRGERREDGRRSRLRRDALQDATHTFDLKADGHTFSTDELARVAAANLAGGQFARVVATKDILGAFVRRRGDTSTTQEMIHGAI
ncbi:MAG TPA: hypothetical protein VGC67_04790 [Cellulomonas sp.]